VRLRQVALVARDLEPVRQALESVFGLKVAFRDPGVATYGLINVVMPFGGEFIEIVQPVTADASAGRLLAKRGGDAGYMLIFQAPDAVRHRGRFVERGIRNIAELNSHRYTFTHFHPGDVDGVLTSIDTEGDGANWNEPRGSWTPAGPDWRNADAGPDIVGILGATVQVANPLATATRWTELFEGRLEPGARPLPASSVLIWLYAIRRVISIVPRSWACAPAHPPYVSAVWRCGCARRVSQHSPGHDDFEGCDADAYELAAFVQRRALFGFGAEGFAGVIGLEEVDMHAAFEIDVVRKAHAFRREEVCLHRP